MASAIPSWTLAPEVTPSTSVSPDVFNYRIHRPIIYSVIAIFTVLGLWGNINLVVVHARKPSLRNKYGTLLCTLSFCQSFCLAFEWIGITYSLTHVVVRNVCFPLLLPYVFMHCMQTGLLATISVDLLISMVAPLRHRVFAVKRYICIICMPTVVYGLVCVILGSIYMDHEVLPMCNPPSSLHPFVNLIWYMGAMIAGGITIFNYAVTFTIILFKNVQRRFSNSGRKGRRDPLKLEKKALRSITVILFIFIFSRYVGTVVSTTLRFLKVDPAVISLYQNYNVFFAIICYSQNYYVCFTTSSEYRRLLKEQLVTLFNRVQSFHQIALPSSVIFQPSRITLTNKPNMVAAAAAVR